jgi:putative FmdB family regulatory protein
MPLFDFHCRECNLDFEELVRGSDMPVCPECKSGNVEKRVSMPAAPGRTADLLARARSQAAREGHFSNYAASERPRRK